MIFYIKIHKFKYNYKYLNLNKDLILDIKPEPGKIVLWPSNFLFPHQATSVTKGIRYTLVSWMI